MTFTFLDIIHLLIIALTLLFAVFLITAKTKNFTSNSLLATYLIVEVLDMGATLSGMFIYPEYPGLGMVISSTITLKEPTLFLYVLSVIYSDFKLSWKHLIHTMYFFILILVFTPRFFSVGFEEKLAFLSNTEYRNIFEIRFTYIFIHLISLSYLSVIFFYLVKYKKLLLENYSNSSMFNYRWLFSFVGLIAIISVFGGLKNIILFTGSEQAFDISMIILTIVMFFYISWIVLRALNHPELFRGIDSGLQLTKNLKSDNQTSSNKEAKNPKIYHLDPNKNKKIKDLNELMETEKPYLDPSITIFSLSRQLKIPSRELSILINQDLKQHFFDFINSHRIEEAMILLRDPAKSDHTVSEILYKVGFNSKSSFNTAFKKHCGSTPTQYRKNSSTLRV